MMLAINNKFNLRIRSIYILKKCDIFVTPLTKKPISLFDIGFLSLNYILNIFISYYTKLHSSPTFTVPPFKTFVNIPFLGIIHSPT